jgi:membrane protease YdiL (CAAX protease family)
VRIGRININIKLMLALPGLILGLIGLLGSLWLGVDFSDLPLEILIPAALTAFFTIAFLSALFERFVPSFSYAGGMLEGIMQGLGLNGTWAFVLALTSSLGEELFFRGFLLALGIKFLPVWLAVLAQALVFAAFHPAPAKAWGYPLWTALVGIVLALVTFACGSVEPAILAHYLFNHTNLNQAIIPRASNRNGS